MAVAKPGSRPGPALRTFGRMADDCFAHPRLAAICDPLDPDRGDLDAYLRMADDCWR